MRLSLSSLDFVGAGFLLDWGDCGRSAAGHERRIAVVASVEGREKSSLVFDFDQFITRYMLTFISSPPPSSLEKAVQSAQEIVVCIFDSSTTPILVKPIRGVGVVEREDVQQPHHSPRPIPRGDSLRIRI